MLSLDKTYSESNKMQYTYPEPKKDHIVKKISDRIFSCIALACLSPLFLLLAFFISLDGFLNRKNKGSIFYKEERISGGKAFKIYKFRTIRKEGLRWVKHKPEERSISMSASKTRAGNFIRKFYLDELPQLINILKGEMSFVGPRPRIPLQVEKECERNIFYSKLMPAGMFCFGTAVKKDKDLCDIYLLLAKSFCARYSINVPITIDTLYFMKYNVYSPIRLLCADIAIMARYFFIFLKAEGP